MLWFEKIKKELKDLPVWDDEEDKKMRREFLKLLKSVKQGKGLSAKQKQGFNDQG